MDTEKTIERLYRITIGLAARIGRLEKRIGFLEERPGEVLEEIHRLWTPDPEVNPEKIVVDSVPTVGTKCFHDNAESENDRHASQEIQGRLLLGTQGNERTSAGMDREVCEGSRKETKEVTTRKEAAPATGATVTDA